MRSWMVHHGQGARNASGFPAMHRRDADLLKEPRGQEGGLPPLVLNSYSLRGQPPFLTLRHSKLSVITTHEVIRYNCRMPKYIDVTTWARRDLFEFFRGFDKPSFNICTSVDCTRLLEFLSQRPKTSVTLT